MRRNLVFVLTILLLVLNGCKYDKGSEIVAYYGDETIYNSDIEMFVEMKHSIMEIYYTDLQTKELVVQQNEKITELEYLKFIEYCQFEVRDGLFEEYFLLSENELINDYYVSLARYEYFLEEFGSVEPIEEIENYLKKEIQDISKMYHGGEINEIISEIAQKHNIPYDECIEKVYIKVGLDMWLQDFMPTIFINEYYQGDIYEDVPTDKLLEIDTFSEHDYDLNEYWNTTENYYDFISDVNKQFYEFLVDKAMEKLKIVNMD